MNLKIVGGIKVAPISLATLEKHILERRCRWVAVVTADFQKTSSIKNFGLEKLLVVKVAVSGHKVP